MGELKDKVCKVLISILLSLGMGGGTKGIVEFHKANFYSFPSVEGEGGMSIYNAKVYVRRLQVNFS